MTKENQTDIYIEMQKKRIELLAKLKKEKKLSKQETFLLKMIELNLPKDKQNLN